MARSRALLYLSINFNNIQWGLMIMAPIQKIVISILFPLCGTGFAKTAWHPSTPIILYSFFNLGVLAGMQIHSQCIYGTYSAIFPAIFRTEIIGIGMFCKKSLYIFIYSLKHVVKGTLNLLRWIVKSMIPVKNTIFCNQRSANCENPQPTQTFFVRFYCLNPLLEQDMPGIYRCNCSASPFSKDLDVQWMGYLSSFIPIKAG